MKHIFFIIIFSYFGILCFGQNSDCPLNTNPETDTSFVVDIFGNYGSVTNAVNSQYSTTGSLGEPFIGNHFGQNVQGAAGFYSNFLLPPAAPMLQASQGELLDRIQLTWEVDPLSPSASQGFNIYRDGIFLENVGPEISTYNDFNVIAGKTYTYGISAINSFGEGSPGQALGFQVPNGVVTGWVRTPNGTPIEDAMVTLSPIQGFSGKFGQADGALIDSNTIEGNNLFPVLGEPWSFTFWMRTDSASSSAGLMNFSPSPIEFRPVNSFGNQDRDGVIIDIDGADNLRMNFPDSTRKAWHHIGLTYDGSKYMTYLDGVLNKVSSGDMPGELNEVTIGALTENAGYWTGNLDEVRMYHRQLNQIEFEAIMTGTASSLTPDLKYYWKFDEGEGSKSFDLINRDELLLCGASFVEDRPQVAVAGQTNDEGYYRIESASYGTGTTFLAKASKDFYAKRAISLKGSDNDQILLPDFPLPNEFTIEMWVNSFGAESASTILSKVWGGNFFFVGLQNLGTANSLAIGMNGNFANFGSIDHNEYHHIAINLITVGTSKGVNVFIDGVSVGGQLFPNVIGNFSDDTNQWGVGSNTNAGNTQTMTGLIDEIAFYGSTLTQAEVQNHFNNERDITENGLLVYYPMDEGFGATLSNVGSTLLEQGNNVGGDWSFVANFQETTPHIFTPGIRQVTLNPSVTSVDQVDFTDRSTVPVTGFVRFEGTDCFAQNVEILVNGSSFASPIFTDSTGRFIIEFDPGASAILTPKLEDHIFSPSSYEVNNLSNPIFGVVFNDLTKRTVTGQVAGGSCMKSIIDLSSPSNQTTCIVKIASTDGCYEQQLTIDNEAGNYDFANVPPLEQITVAVIEHSNPAIKQAFEVTGGSTVNLSANDTIVDFTYLAPPQVELTQGLSEFGPGCDKIVLNQGNTEQVQIRLYEQYGPNSASSDRCYLDTASFSIINGITESEVDTNILTGTLDYEFEVGAPNPSPPYLKTIQFIGTTQEGRSGSLLKQVIVTGIRNKENTFTTMNPEIPMLVLRDPPGDQSYSYWEKDNKTCVTSRIYSEIIETTGSNNTGKLGPKTTITLPLGGPTIETNSTLSASVGASITYKKVSDDALQVCVSASERVTTASGENVVGSDADIYLGVGANLSVGFADVVSFNDTICEAEISQVTNVEPLGVTTFMYSEKYIKDNIIRYLDDITILDGEEMPDSATLAAYANSSAQWTTILELNDSLKDGGQFVRNLSFDAGTSYEYKENSSTHISNNESEFVQTNTKIGGKRGFTANGIGFKNEIFMDVSTSNGVDFDVNGNDLGIVTGYKLADNDTGDGFTVDVGIDSVYKTPTFELIAGQSSCPYEPGTAHREVPTINLDGTPFKAVNVPSKESAVFKFNLGNLSATNEDMTYGLNTIPNSNPHGAVIKVNGQILDRTLRFIVPFGESVPITLTVDRGPIEYEYDSLEIAFYSECEYERNLAVGRPLDSDSLLFTTIPISVEFIRPCSEVDINVPQQNWVKTNADSDSSGTIRRITVSGYDLSSEDFKLIRVQYRKTNGDGAWINIQNDAELYNANWSGFTDSVSMPVLGREFSQFEWETVGLEDGDYEIYAWAVCEGPASANPGFSEVVQGRIDRQPPAIIGTPQPSDGVLQVGDEISVTFNKNIECDLQTALASGSFNVGLFDVATNSIVAIDITCFENKILIDPTFNNEEIENKILRLELRDIPDLVGNTMNYESWEFYVDRNELAWMTDSIGVTKYENDEAEVVAKIYNRGGSPTPFEITGLPDWARIFPDEGTLVPNEIRDVTISIDENLAFGEWSDTLTLTTITGQNPFFMGGSESLPLGARVICQPPNWDVDPGQFENSMSLILEPNIEGVLSTDMEDIIVAYIGDEILGKGHVQYVEEVGSHLVFLTVYGNPEHVGQTIELEIWDASKCLRYGDISGAFTFQPDMVIGALDSPQLVMTSGTIERELPLGLGWNWVSFNLDFLDNSLNSALTDLNNPDGDLIRSQGPFAENFGGAWFGPLTNLSDTSMYIYRTRNQDTLKFKGTVIDPALRSIQVGSGWNWIGYIPNYALPINEALSSLTLAQNGDLIKSQYAFAQYINPSHGWVGNLEYMRPLEGYQIKLTNSGMITFPPSTGGLHDPSLSGRDGDSDSFWTFNPKEYPNNMTMVAFLEEDDKNISDPNFELGVFFGEQLRAVARPVFVQARNEYVYFITILGEKEGEELTFKWVDKRNGEIFQSKDQAHFHQQAHLGSIENPFPLRIRSEVAQVDAHFDVHLFPNPSSDRVFIECKGLDLDETIYIDVINASGEIVDQYIEYKIDPTLNYSFKHLQPGIYTLMIKQGEETVYKRFARIN